VIEIESDSSPFMTVVRRGLEAVYHWDGLIELEILGVRYSGSGSVHADVSSINGTIHEAVDISAAASFRRLLNTKPGTLRTDDDFGSALPCDGQAWKADRVTTTGFSITGNDQVLRFAVTGDLLVPAQSSGEACFWRYVYQGAGLPAATAFTDLKHGGGGTEYSLDRITGNFRGRRLDLRNLTEANEGARSFIAAIHDGVAPLEETESTALWLLISYLSGARLRSIYNDSFDSAGVMLQRSYRLGVAYSERTMAPFDSHAARPTDDALTIIGDGFVRMIEAKFPIGIIIHHLLDANTRNPEVDSIHLYLALQTVIEAWSLHRGANEIIDQTQWKTLRRKLIGAAEDILAEAPERLTKSIVNRIAGGNQTSYNERQRRVFSEIGVVLDDSTKHALSMRNELFHFGYFRRRFNQLSREEKQARLDLVGILRNLVNVIILKLVGYDGYLVEATRHEAIRIERGPASFGAQ
jgi:hypothetical protein